MTSKCVSTVAYIAALLFAVHPIHTESVSLSCLLLAKHLFKDRGKIYKT